MFTATASVIKQVRAVSTEPDQAHILGWLVGVPADANVRILGTIAAREPLDAFVSDSKVSDDLRKHLPFFIAGQSRGSF